MESKRKNRKKRKKSTTIGASAGPDAIYTCKCVYFRGKKTDKKSQKRKWNIMQIKLPAQLDN